jgi:hypothetical protein
LDTPTAFNIDEVLKAVNISVSASLKEESASFANRVVSIIESAKPPIPNKPNKPMFGCTIV